MTSKPSPFGKPPDAANPIVNLTGVANPVNGAGVGGTFSQLNSFNMTSQTNTNKPPITNPPSSTQPSGGTG